MSTSSVEVQLVKMENGELKYIKKLRIPANTIPAKDTKFNTNISKFGIYKNSKYLVHDVIYEYTDTDDGDGYGNWGKTEVVIKLVVELVSYETNEPAPVPQEPAVKKVRKSKKTV